jgi:hypothetical protein
MDADPFVIRMNINHFRALLKTETDERKRQVVGRLLAEVEAVNMSFKAKPPAL